MLSHFSGPHGAEEEREAHGRAQNHSGEYGAEFASVAGLNVPEPYSPAVAHLDSDAPNADERNEQNESEFQDELGAQDEFEDESGAQDEIDMADTQELPATIRQEGLSRAQQSELQKLTDPDIHADPLGSWTGVPEENVTQNATETPTQDADDL